MSHEDLFLYSSSVYSCHLFLISSASVRSIPFLTFIVPILTHRERPWFWEGLGAGGEGDNRGWDGWMASPTQWAWVWENSGSWWWTGRPGVLWFTGLQRVRHDWATELNWTCMKCSHDISNFLEEISSLPHSIVFLYLFALITEEGFLISPCYSLELCIQMGISFLFSLAFSFSSFLSYI